MSTVIIYTVVFLYGIAIGSFMNVCILRIPAGETIVSKRSHCMSCGYQLRWYDLIPLFSYIFLRGKCRKCGEKISLQYPMIEAFNGIMWVLCFVICGMSIDTVLICLTCSALTVLSVIDFRTYEIPFGINVFIFAMGAIMTALHIENWSEHIIGFFSVSTVLLALFLITGGRGIGGGDIKLMAVAGLLLGWKLCIMAFIFGCLYGSVIHLIRMKLSDEGRVLALGPYLSMGILTVMWFGEEILQAYLSLFAV